MPKAKMDAKPRAARPLTQWEANCLFCGEALPDEGAGFLDHIEVAPGCTTAYASWLEHLDEDHPGG